jgi:membrane-bound lytic murein transglycosylase D
MKRFFHVACCILIGGAQWLSAQSYQVEVPSKMEVAGMKLYIRDGAKGPIKNYCDKLTINNKFFRQLVDRADAYMPIIERIFEEEGLPNDFKYLVIQESSLVSDQVSSSNAVGYWQFKKETALEMGLRVDDEVDERMNIVASSRAAARYIKRHNLQFDNWMYSLLGYYAGASGAKMLIDPNKIGARELDIDENTHWYLLKFLAYKITFQDNLNRNTKPILLVMEYDNCENKTLKDIAYETNYPLEDLEFYNKWAKKGFIPGDKDYVVAIPVKPEQQEAFLANYTDTPRINPEMLKPWKEKTFFGLIEKPVTNTAYVTNGESNNSGIPVFYSWNGIKAIIAEPGDNIDKIAIRAGISKEQFLEYNDLRIFDQIRVGQVYYVKHKNRRAKIPYHTVKPNETLWEISQNYGIKLNQLLKKNRMERPEKLKPGRVLWLRKRMPEDEPIKYEKVPEPPLIKPAPPIVQKSSNTAVAEDKPIAQAPIDAVKPQLSYLQEKEFTNAELKRISEKVKEALGADTLPTSDEDENEERDEELVASTSERAIVKTTTGFTNTQKVKVQHKVEPRQTIYGISRNYQVAVDSIMAWNRLESQSLSVGQQIVLYVNENIANKPKAETVVEQKVVKHETPAPQKVESKETKPVEVKEKSNEEVKSIENTAVVVQDQFHEVQAGETLYRISKKYGVKVEDILSWNNKIEPVISIGEKLRIKPQ